MLSAFEILRRLFDVVVIDFAGWLDCPAYGQAIGHIIPTKVPLSESFNHSIPAGKTHTPNQVIHQQRILGREVSVGLVVQTSLSAYIVLSSTKYSKYHI